MTFRVEAQNNNQKDTRRTYYSKQRAAGSDALASATSMSTSPSAVAHRQLAAKLNLWPAICAFN